MRSTVVLLLASLAAAVAAPPRPELAQVHKVYMLPMSNGMDQFLANRLTNQGLIQVVTDPKKADAVFTDRLGDAIESLQTEWFPDAPAKPEAGAAAPAAGAGEGATTPGGFGGDNPTPVSAFHRAKGTIFLVDARSRQVLWSIYAQPKTAASEELDRTAERIASRLRQDLKKH